MGSLLKFKKKRSYNELREVCGRARTVLNKLYTKDIALRKEIEEQERYCTELESELHLSYAKKVNNSEKNISRELNNY